MADLIMRAEGTVTTKGARGPVRFANQADSVQLELEAAYLNGVNTDGDLGNEIGSSQSYRFLQDQYG